ncbi:MAG: cytochrome P450 [Solirubrobacteraceae bacterium]
MYVRAIDTSSAETPSGGGHGGATADGAGAAPVDHGLDPAAVDPHDPAFLADPYPVYARLREHAPIRKVEPYGSWWVFRYADCVRALEEQDVWVKNPPGGTPPPGGPFAMMASFPESLFVADPPFHERLRGLLEPGFASAIGGAEELAREFAMPLLRAAREEGSLELVSGYAVPLPAAVLFAIMGIPDGGAGQPTWKGLIAWAEAIAAAHDITQPVPVRGIGATCSMALNSFFEGMLLGRARGPQSEGGLFAEMCRALLDAGLSTQQVQVCASDFLVAGYLSTTFIIALSVRNLLLHPDQLQKLRADPALLGAAFEEMLRFDPPVHIVDRCAAIETELGGHAFAPGERISVVLGSADRDPDAFPDPDRFDIERDASASLSFGWGIHHCIGAPLARTVGPVALELLLAQFEDLALDGEPQWQADPYLRAPTSLPLRL